MQRTLNYRPHIDGLRAIAVLSVVAYHAFPSIVKGGFIGVDIFFVISGYLITSLINQEIAQGNFSYIRFFERRVRRLLPPLIPVVFIAWAIGFLLFNDTQFQNVVHSIYASVGFASNWYFFSEISYFDKPGALTPLLHFWSLAVEEQFYLIFPTILIVTSRWQPSWRAIGLLVVFIASAIYAHYLVFSGFKDLAFFNSGARFWELLSGCLLSLVFKSNLDRFICSIMEIMGLLLIFAAIFLFRSTMAFPGEAAVVPVLGAVLIIAADGKGRFLSPLLASRVAVWIGLISYPLYLWHWPLLVLLHFANPSASWTSRLIILIVSVLLSILSYHFVELPIRQKHTLKTSRSIFTVITAAMMSLAFLAGFSSTNRVKNLREITRNQARELMLSRHVRQLARLDEDTAFYMANLNVNSDGTIPDYEYGNQARTCSFDKGNTSNNVLICLSAQSQKSNVLVIGDSVGRDTWHALRRAYPNTNFLMLHQSSCPPTGQEKYLDSKEICFPHIIAFLKKIANLIKIDTIVVSFNYDSPNWEKIGPALQTMKNISGRVILFGVTPQFGISMPDLIRSLPRDEPPPIQLAQPNPSLVERARTIANKYGVTFMDVASFFCPGGQCPLWTDSSEESPLFFDSLHLTNAGINRYSIFLKNQAINWKGITLVNMKAGAITH